jgi:hypothetical protein
MMKASLSGLKAQRAKEVGRDAKNGKGSILGLKGKGAAMCQGHGMSSSGASPKEVKKLKYKG